jgi:hypothetical protein
MQRGGGGMSDDDRFRPDAALLPLMPPSMRLRYVIPELGAEMRRVVIGNMLGRGAALEATRPGDWRPERGFFPRAAHLDEQ